MSSEQPKTPVSANRQIARAAGTVMAAMIIGQLVGLFAKVLTARAFGTSPDSEAFWAANRFTEILFTLVAGGALGSAFIPTFTGFITQNKQQSAWRLAAAVANLVTLVLTILSIISAVFAPQVVRYILAPGFSDIYRQNLTAGLLRVQLISSVIFGLSGLLMGVLNAHQVFLYPALAPAFYQLGWIFGLLVLKPTLGVFGLAWGVVIGAVLHLAVQIPAWLRLPGRSYAVTFGLDDPAVREVARLMAPRLLGVAVVQLNFWLNTYLASGQPQGSLTGINLAFPLMIMPQAAIAQSAAIAALPTFSAQAALGKYDEVRASLAATLRGVLMLALPASIGLMLLGRPLVAALYERGEFTSISTNLVAWALVWYAAGLVGHSVVEVAARAFYALHDTKTPVIMTTAAMGLNLVFSLMFSFWFASLGWAPHGGLALANSLATAMEMVGLLVLMRRKLGGLEIRLVWDGVKRSLTASLGMGAVLIGWLMLSGNLSSWVVMASGVVMGGGVYVFLLAVLRAPELQAGMGLVRRLASRFR